MKSARSFYYLIMALLIILSGLVIHSLFVLEELQGRINNLEQKIENPQTRIIPVQ